MKENDEKLSVCYRTVVLGQLSKNSNGDFVYESNLQNEEKLLKQGVLTKSEYELWGSDKRSSDTLFPDIKNILKNFSREDILATAGINSSDSDWNKLVKLSKFEVGSTNLYIQQVTSANNKGSEQS